MTQTATQTATPTSEYAVGDTLVFVKHGSRVGHSPSWTHATIERITPTGMIRAKSRHGQFTLTPVKYGRLSIVLLTEYGFKDDRWSLSTQDALDLYKEQRDRQLKMREIGSLVQKTGESLINGSTPQWAIDRLKAAIADLNQMVIP